MDDMLVDLRTVAKRWATPDKSTPGADARSNTVVVRTTSGKRRGAVAGAAVLVAALIVIVFVVTQRDKTPRDRAAIGGDRGTIKSLAVLPFDNMMDDPEQDYFVDGMHDALITGLSKLGSLRVISRTSVMRYKQTKKPMTEIARELDVDVLI